MGGMLIGRANRNLTLIDFLLFGLACDAIVFDSDKTTVAGSRQMSFEIVQIEVIADVAMELAIARVPRVALVAAPNLSGRFGIASKGGQAAWGENRREGSVTR